MKKLLAVLLSTVLIFSNGFVVAAEPELDTPIDIEIIDDYQYTFSISSAVSISGNMATCKSVVEGYFGVATKIVVSQTLQKKNGSTWSDITGWNKTFNSWYASYTTTTPAQGHGNYRLKTVARVYSGSNYETITTYSITYTY